MTPHHGVKAEAQRHRMMRETASPDFLDPSAEWRRLFSECWGTFLLVLVAAGAGVVAAKSEGGVTLTMAVVAPGLARNIGSNGGALIAVGFERILKGPPTSAGESPRKARGKANDGHAPDLSHL